MATATKTKLQNFIDGEFVDAADGATEEVTNPANGEVIAEMQLSGEEDVDRAVKAATRAFPGWAATTPGERAAAILKLADLLEEHAEELADLEAADAGKPRGAFLEDEMPFLCDNLRFFAGAGRMLEGKSAGEYMREPHLVRPSRTGRGGRPDRPVELPADDGDLEDRPGARHRLHDRPEAGGDDSGQHAQAGRATRASACRRACST